MRRSDLKGLSFSLLTDEILESRSVLTISSTEVYKKGTALYPSITDPRLGTITPNVLCSTCSGIPETCNGHLGHIELHVPIVPAMFLPMICKVLTCICVACANLLLVYTADKRTDLLNIPSKKRLSEMYTRSSKAQRVCTHCHNIQPLKWIAIDSVLIRPVWAATVTSLPIITPMHVYTLLQMIHTDDTALFGFLSTNLSFMMIRLFPVPPTLIRPPRSSRMEDDLSIRLRAIVHANVCAAKSPHPVLNLSVYEDRSDNALVRPDWRPRHQRNKQALVPEHLEAYYELQRQCAGFQDAKYCSKNDMDYGRELMSVRHRFVSTKHKRGRIRANILGKRGDFTARAVASPSVDLHPHEVGVPIQICSHLTIRERVCALNYTKLQFLVYQGPDNYPGANYVERNGEKFTLPIFRLGLQIGDVVHRHLQHGDTVIMNRQPSLHRYSMMAYRIVPIPYNTFQLHLAVTTAHNLDYDGDEVNLFVPGSLESSVEMSELMSVHENLFKDNRLLIGFVQHACLAMYLLTRHENFVLERTELQQMLYASGFDIAQFETRTQTGRQLVQQLLPTYNGTAILTKSLFNRLATTYLQLSPRTNVDKSRWIGFTVRFLDRFLLRHGSTLTFEDCRSSARNTGLLQQTQRVLSPATTEQLVIKILDKVRNVVGCAVHKELSARTCHHLIDIVDSGAKGNMSHIIQNVGMVGQQFGTHIERHAALMSHDVDPLMQRGFVVSAFSDGLGPVEFFHHLKSSRVGLVGTAVSTAETGYCYRRISKGMEDLCVTFDHSVRTAAGGLVSFVSGFVSDCVIRSVVPVHGGPTMVLPFDLANMPPCFVAKTVPVTLQTIAKQVATFCEQLRRKYVPPHLVTAVATDLHAQTLYDVHCIQHQCTLQWVLQYVEDRILRSLQPPGTPIGLIVAQSFSEPLTQIQLNQFHHSGEGAGIYSGITRIKEVINCMKEITHPSMMIVPLSETLIDIYSLVCVRLNDVLDCWYLHPTRGIVFCLRRKNMIEHTVTPRIVSLGLQQCITDDIHYTTDLDNTTWEVWFHHTGSSVLARDRVRVFRKTNPLISGIPNITDYYLTTREINHVPRTCLITHGSNLRGICHLPWIDHRYTTSNHLMELYAVYGIDAVCAAISQELSLVMSTGSVEVARGYIHIIAHTICRTGTPCALTFNGLSNANTSTLKLATFERSLDSFVRAACTQHADDLSGVSESVIVGKAISMGTGGRFELLETVQNTPPRTQLTTTGTVFPILPADITLDVTLPIIVTPQGSHPKRPAAVLDDTRPAKRPKVILDNPYIDSTSAFVPYRPLALTT